MLSLRDGARNLDVLRWIGRNISMPKKFVEEVINRAGIEVDKNAGELSDDEVIKIYNTIKDIVNEVSISGKKHEPIVILLNDKPQEALPIITQEQLQRLLQVDRIITRSKKLHRIWMQSTKCSAMKSWT